MFPATGTYLLYVPVYLTPDTLVDFSELLLFEPYKFCTPKCLVDVSVIHHIKSPLAFLNVSLISLNVMVAVKNSEEAAMC